MSDPILPVTRRALLGSSAASVAILTAGEAKAGNVAASAASIRMPVSLTVNGTERLLTLDPRTTLLDALREHLQLTGTKKGCDHGQCGACTVIVNGERINSCLSLAVQHAGDEVTTIEGLGTPDKLHPMQDAFVEHDGYQCGYCTPGQICSSVAMLKEIARGVPSHVTGDLDGEMRATDVEIRERMSGNICRCGAYSNIAAAIADVARG
ncbi:aldehyde dehydrogenase iron-sulfur subunit [Tsuneonella sp. YG55]|uniref:Aldehyde oxidoreductase iron-sulfur-binding subunit PaoA n=1 Tax=Tsuneonella litorea TaxID=2976475 RepID=A0A9X3A6M4_9SPHN|nr:aldehyde dehydrogenase iron-sulfur subunit PaoA [Tsuneonella litorea]MCT2557491.1 aldehyde dehydrogenase iron-sulfur subunit [Tsuneonella litorea]